MNFKRLISSAGPEGWLEWALAFRNMLVHRGRRIGFGQFVQRTPVLYGAGGQTVLRARRVTHLPRDPGRSDVEVFLEAPNSPLLTEGDDQTLRALMESMKALVEGIAQELGEVWNWRRTHRDRLVQPAAQWPDGASTESIGFLGYAPASFQYAPSMMTTHPVVFKRMRAAALDDDARPQWKTFN